MARQNISSPSSLILVVDDDPAVRFLTREVLEQSGFRVTEAENGALALSAFTELHPDMVLLDVIMPELDGFTVCSKLRNSPNGEHTPIMMMTGLDDVESIRTAYEVGATDFVVKPINWAILSHRVRYMLRASAAFAGIKESEARLANAQRIARLGNWDWDIRRNYWRVSEECYRIFGEKPKAPAKIRQTFLNAVHPDERVFVSAVHDLSLKEGKPCNIEYHIQQPDGSQRIIHEQAEVSFDGTGRAVSMAGTVQDITERKQAEEKIRYLAYYDTLTGLPNRQFLMQNLELAIGVANRHQRLAALLFLDLDNFKRINDTLGHTIGDLLLKAIAERLLDNVRMIDCVARSEADSIKGHVARLGGDEFTLLLTEIQRIEDAALVAQRIQEIVAQPLKIAEHEIIITPSIGIAMFPNDGKNVNNLLKNADMAMYHAKAAGKNTFKFYTEPMNNRALQQLDLESKLRSALEQQELLLHYQPKVDVCSGAIVGVEALLRWRNPELGLVSPTDFIPLAEDTGLIMDIGEWVVRTACDQNQAWQAAGFAPLCIAVNLSSLQFRQGDLLKIINQALLDTKLEPHCLELELTESVIMQNARETIETLHKLKNKGLKLSVDDFGTGYSSLSYLKRFPLDALKIDQSFIKDVTTDPDDAAITTAIIAMAHSLNLKVFAEGVETDEQLAFLRKYGCDQVQGFLLGKPMAAEEFSRLLENRVSLRSN